MCIIIKKLNHNKTEIMKKNNQYFVNITGILAMALLLLSAGWYSVSAQSVVPFNPRASTPASSTGTYNIKGDFQMLGNSNLVAANDLTGSSTSQSNATNMVYVNVEPATGIVNSSSATLQFPNISGVDPACSEIVYAGLYWSGRADNGGNASNTFSVTSGAAATYNTNVTTGNSSNGYNLTIATADDSSNGGNNGTLTTYTFTPQASGDAVVFRFYTWRTTTNNNSYTNKVTVQVGTGTVQTLSGTASNNTNYSVTLSTPYALPIGTGLVTVLQKVRGSGQSVSNNFYATVNTPAVAGTTANLDKAKVKFKFAGDTYQDIPALGGTAINYPPTNYGQMYAGYADVTAYVKAHGAGNYTVANIALREGNGGDTGYYGSWGLVVVYKNPFMVDKSITVFDGYGYMASGGGTQTLNVSGFSTPPSGAVNATIGVMGGEGDLSIAGDPFSIQQKNTTTYRYLDHNGNSTTSTPTGAYNNFFDSSITIAGNPPRNPNHMNNYGSDIHMLNLVNASNSIIGNSQTSTSFQYGSSQDTYIIYSIAFSVDNYVPQPTSSISASSIVNGSTVNAGDNFTVDYDITNPGNEAVINSKLTIPIPFNQEYVSSSVNSWDVSLLGPQVSPVFTPAAPGQVTGGTLTWNLGTLPLMSAADKNRVMASLQAQFRITTNCLLLTAPTCSGVTEQNSYMTGTGQVSGQTVQLPTITGSTTTSGGCTVPSTNPFSFALNIDSSTLNCPSNIITDPNDPTHKIVTYNAGASTIPRATVANDFPAGTIFYTKSPSDPTFNAITDVFTGDFNAPANGSDPAIRYYAVAPNMPANCYFIISISRGLCYNLPAGGTGTDTKHGITLLQRAGASPASLDNWPMVRKSAHTVLESNTKGFVISRMTTNQINQIKTDNHAVEGMMVYDTDLKCLKLYDGTNWSCFNKPACP